MHLLRCQTVPHTRWAVSSRSPSPVHELSPGRPAAAGLETKQASGIRWIRGLLICLVVGWMVADARSAEGDRLWLRFDRLPTAVLEPYETGVTGLRVAGSSDTAAALQRELQVGFEKLLGRPVPVVDDSIQAGMVVAGTPQSSDLIRGFPWRSELEKLREDGFRIRSATVEGHPVTVIAANTDLGILYGGFHFLRLLQMGSSIQGLDVVESPRFQRRLLNHWDNLDGTIERGYAGSSLWDWDALPETVSPRMREYARANASVGLNGSVLNNVNADARVLSPEYLPKIAALADAFRPYGVRVYLSARFSAPMELDGLPTADPLDPAVMDWWKAKAEEIYRVIPDFGGFLVKANSEGQPGPRTYGRDHVDGANMLASALAPHGGIVMWRAFVYDMKEGYDRAGAAFEHLQPFDGRFATNVLLQVKNGPIDFQPREPFHPLFGAMPQTQLMPELQITQEYLGFANHLVFLAPMWSEVLTADTYAEGPGSTVARVVDGRLYGQRLTAIAGVANTGSDRNWTGHPFAQANWYAFGRLAWDPDLNPAEIAQEWIRMTFSVDEGALEKLISIMLESHQAAVDYMTPLGLHHIMWGGHHYGPAPWWDREKRDDWNPVYYHRADADGLGFDRSRSGSGTVQQYHEPLESRFNDMETCPTEYILWFHHVPWDHEMPGGRTLWEELALRYQRGVEWVRKARAEWAELDGTIDAERHEFVTRKLALQERDAVHWRDACLLYFQTFSKRPLPDGVEEPADRLETYQAKSLEW